MESESFRVEDLQLVKDDPFLLQYADAIRGRREDVLSWLKRFDHSEGGLESFSKSHARMGFFFRDDGLHFREWAPNAKEMHLFGEFNQWNLFSHPCTKDSFGFFEIVLPYLHDGKSPIAHNTKIKISLTLPDGKRVDRIPSWITRAYQDGHHPVFVGNFWNPPPYEWKHPTPKRPKSLKIYEAHVGMSSPEPKISTYVHFRDHVLPRVHSLGYNAVELMAIMEHAYYASFGYQVTNFFAASSRFGTPEELKSLVDRAHELGIIVLIDIVHSHASKNTVDGLNFFDGSDSHLFHGGGRGQHPLWDSRLFNYGQWETMRFLLSNLHFWVDEYHFDGFRFDGVTSMLFRHHGLGHDFSNMDEYYDGSVDPEALAYLTLANIMLHNAYPDIVTIAEDVSGYPGLCRPFIDGGVGFDYRMGMSIPDKWVEVLKTCKDEDWNMGNICYTLSDRRYMESTVAYVECHDQALVGSKTLAFWLMDKEMYDGMSILTPPSLVVDRGIALHKMIRLLTHSMGGEAYLNFAGNEFGHPEWIDFPREGNGYSYHHCRRRFDLMDDQLLRYHHLSNFDAAMNKLEEEKGWLPSAPAYITKTNEDDKVISYERGGLVFAFNFHPTKSFSDYPLDTATPGCYKVVLHTDKARFGGHRRVEESTVHFTQPDPTSKRGHIFLSYLPSRCALIFARMEEKKEKKKE
eukprot:TRINITY_DN292_c0_g3_i1.p1 TRINITY_DN292_c0_g3~~TRINITY_DN292_c0_g3_i1.p1  ORF type:complete len:687 (+),score=175.83 TRINITY_DN292_c0_g3_i1:141-2201(+)